MSYKNDEKAEEQLKEIFEDLDLESENLDLIVLTEVNESQRNVIMDNYSKKYTWKESDNRNTNKVLIGLNNNFADFVADDIDLLKARFKTKKSKQMVTVIGCRMTTGGNNSKEQYDSECVAFNATLIPLIQKSIEDNKDDIIILTGDFNHARCLGNLNSKFNENDYEGCKQNNYNLNLIKDWLGPYGFKMADIEVQIEVHNEEQKNKTSRNNHNDHIFVRGLDKVACKWIDTKPWSDHDAIYAELSNEP